MTVWTTDHASLTPTDARQQLLTRRKWVLGAASGAVLSALGGTYALSDSLTRAAKAQLRADGRPRLPPGQRVLEALKPMGGEPGDPNPSAFRLRVGGEVETPFELTLRELLSMESVELATDVHCVTGWSVLGARFRGVRVRELAKKAGVKPSARHVIFEAAHGYTANTTLASALDPAALVAWELNGARLARPHGAPVRAVNPDVYFWKSPKWLTGIRFVARDEPGYWEVRGYHNRADPWKEERYA